MAPLETRTAGHRATNGTKTAALTIVPEGELRRIIESVSSPLERHALLGAACRINTLTIIARAGSGHIGSSFSAMDVLVHLMDRELDVRARGFDDPERDVFFSSKGHDVPALYAVLNAFGVVPMEDLLRLRRIDGPCGHPDRRCPFMETTTGSLGMGISKGKGMALARRVAGRSGRIVVMTGDGELQEGQCWEAVQSAAHLALDNLIVVVDHNRVQSDRRVDETMPLGDLEARFDALGWHVSRCDGHDAAGLAAVFGRLAHVTGRPKVIIAETIKGRGVSFMEHPHAIEAGGGRYPWHAGAPRPDAYAEAIAELTSTLEALARDAGLGGVKMEIVPPHVDAPRAGPRANLVAAYGEELLHQACAHEALVVLDADLASDCGLTAFAETFPERFFEHGIAEQDMVSTAGGLAHQGLLPVVNSFAAFLVSRANEQIYLNACDGARVIYACHYAGLTPAGPGPTHQSLRDVSLLAATPGVLVVQPATESETRRALAFAVSACTESVALRLQLGAAPVVPESGEETFVPGRGSVLGAGSDAVIFAYGPVMLDAALDAARHLARSSLALRVVNMPWLNHVDVEWLAEVVGDVPHVYVLEDHAPLGALGDMMREAVVALHVTGHTPASTVETLGVEGLPAWGTAAEVLAAHGLDGPSLAARIGADLEG